MWYFTIFSSILLVSAKASGEFSILQAPPSLDFKGSEALPSNSVADVISVCLGYSVQEGSNWSGLFISNVFALPQKAVTLLIEGVDHIHLNNKGKTYPLVGDDADVSLDSLVKALESSEFRTVDINLKEGIDGVDTYSDIFGEIKVPSTEKSSTSNLKPDLHSEDKIFLQQIGILDELTKKLSTLKIQPNLMTIRLSLEQVSKAHGEKSAAFVEALKLLSESSEKFASTVQNTFGEKLLVTVITTKPDNHARAKRQATTPSTDAEKLNLATDYSEDYPVIFNIILWFGVVMAFTLLAISYVIGTMDPGRDSIIYRMTSTRMKKDN